MLVIKIPVNQLQLNLIIHLLKYQSPKMPYNKMRIQNVSMEINLLDVSCSDCAVSVLVPYQFPVACLPVSNWFLSLFLCRSVRYSVCL